MVFGGRGQLANGTENEEFWSMGDVMRSSGGQFSCLDFLVINHLLFCLDFPSFVFLK
jgi:hypothetical protein